MREGWTYKKLGEVCDVTMGQSPEGDSLNEQEGIEFHQGKTCFGERFLGVSSVLTNAPTKLAEAHSVLLCVRAPVGFPNITEREICIGRGLCSLSPSDSLNSSFLFYALLSKQSYFEKNATGSTFKAISSKVINQAEIPLPPKSQQEAIVSELDEINSLLALKREQLQKYDKLAQSLFYEMFGDPVENEKGWKVERLGDVCCLKSGDSKANSAPDGDLPYVKVGDLNHPSNTEYIVCSSRFVNKDFVKKNIFPVGSVIFPKRGESIRTNKKRLTSVEICCDLNLMGVYSNSILLSSLYLFYYFKTIDFCRIVKESSTIPQINNGEIAPLLIPLPPLSLQQQFASRIEQIESQKQQVQEAIEKLETLLASRMQYWFE